jgi:hypothetical protein
MESLPSAGIAVVQVTDTIAAPQPSLRMYLTGVPVGPARVHRAYRSSNGAKRMRLRQFMDAFGLERSKPARSASAREVLGAASTDRLARCRGAVLANIEFGNMKEVAMRTRAWANGLGLFSIALGITELVFAPQLARAFGLKNPTLVRAFGFREIAAGVGVLLLQRKGPGIWARIAGDILDVAVLGSAATHRKTRRNAALAIAAVSPVVALDVVCGKKLGLNGRSHGTS